MEANKCFYDEYTLVDTSTDSGKEMDQEAKLEVEEKRYGINKPQRIIIKGTITHGEID